MIAVFAWIPLAVACDPPPVTARAIEARRRFLTDDYAASLAIARDTLAAVDCVDTLIVRDDLLGLYQVGVAAASEFGDDETALALARASVPLFPDAPWPANVLGAHGAPAWTAARASPPPTVTLTADGPAWLDGRPLGAGAIARVPAGTHLVQQVADDAHVQTDWIPFSADASVGEGPHARPRVALLGGGVGLTLAGATALFFSTEDLFCAGQLVPERSDATCEPLARSYDVTRADYDRLSSRGLALRGVGLAGVGLGLTAAVLSWTF